MSDHEDHQDTLQEYQSPQQNQEEEQAGGNQHREKSNPSFHSGSDTPDKKSLVSEDDEEKIDPEQQQVQPTPTFDPLRTQDFQIPVVQSLKNDHEVDQNHELIGSAPIFHQPHNTTAEVIVGDNDKKEQDQARSGGEVEENNAQPYHEIQPVTGNTQREEEEAHQYAERRESEHGNQRYEKEQISDYKQPEEEPARVSHQQPNAHQAEEHQEQQQTAHQQDTKEPEHQFPQEAEQTTPQNRSESEEQPEPPKAVRRSIQLEPQLIDSNYNLPVQPALNVPATQNVAAEKTQAQPAEQNPNEVRRHPEQQFSNTRQPASSTNEKAISPKKPKKIKEQPDARDSSACACLLF